MTPAQYHFGVKAPFYRDPQVALLHEWDDVMISGYCPGEKRFFIKLRGTVGTVCVVESWLKLWPEKPVGSGKLWFDMRFLRLDRYLGGLAPSRLRICA